jgi:hypothetical protein
VPAISPYIIEPIFERFCALLPQRKVDHPLGCHRPRIPDQVVFEKLVQVLVFGCAYWRIADESCSATTLRRRRDEWIEIGVMEALEKLAREAYDRAIGLDLFDVAVDCCITKAPRGGEKAGKSPVERAKRGIKRSMAVDAQGIPLGVVTAGANRHTTRRFWRPPWRPWRLLSSCPRMAASISIAPTTRKRPESSWRTVGW